MSEYVQPTTLYTMELESRVEAWAAAKIAPKRLAHVKGVVLTAERLAQLYAPEEVMRVRLAGWIHDVAKHWADDQLLNYAESHELSITHTERLVPMLLHGAVGYDLANAVFGFDDPVLRMACALHTTGASSMTIVDKIVFLADMIEPGREFKGVEILRADASIDLDMALLRGVDYTINHLMRKQRIIDPRAIGLRNTLIHHGIHYE